MTALTDRAGHGQIVTAAEGLCAAALGAGTGLPAGYAEQIAAEGLALCDKLGVTRLGDGVVLHTAPEAPGLPRLLGYADGSGQWYGDGAEHATEQPERQAPVGREVAA
jgi:hypothetical protein